MTAPDPFEFASSDESSDEDRPFLSTSVPNVPLPSRKRRSSSTFLNQTPAPKVVIAVLISVIFVLEFGGYLMAVPAIRKYEDIICHHYYNGIEGDGHIGFEETIDEKMCKGEVVQEKLNVLIAGTGFLTAIVGKFLCVRDLRGERADRLFVALVTTIPYGLLADRWVLSLFFLVIKLYMTSLYSISLFLKLRKISSLALSLDQG
jgi:hypothetical protein